MERLGVNLPLLVGGATTSAKHTAVRIAPKFTGDVVHVLDASRSVGVVEALLSDTKRDDFVAKNRQQHAQLVASYAQRQQIELTPLDVARQHKFATDWQSVEIAVPKKLGVQVIEDLPLEKLVPYIDWSPFFMTWELKGKYPKIFEDATVGETARKLFDDAQALLKKIVDGKLLHARGVYGFWPAAADGDDIVLFTDDSRKTVLTRFCTLRQQWQRKGQTQQYALADFIAPLDSGRADYLGAFAVTTGHGVDQLVAQYDRDHDDYNSIMVKALADRLAEAFAEYLHQQARIEWGFGRDESLSNDDLIAEKYRGIRPAPGYPACPDHTEKRTLFNLLSAEKNAGIELTESFAMMPAASVSGLYFGHPQARYFAVDRIDRDQVKDYAKRKGLSVTEVERWLSPNLGYER
jgi:5-methyltetrahydrofolate--homocysteine methyltransferase